MANMAFVDEKPAVGNKIAAATVPADLSYIDRKLNGTCTRYGCKKPAEGDGQQCKKHRAAARRADRRWKQANRAKRKSAKRCVDCDKTTKAGRLRCLACLTRRKARRTKGGDNRVDKYAARMDRIRARTVVEADGRTRYRGQTRRGRQTIADLDDQDIGLAILYLTKCREALRFARRPESADVPRIQRKEAEHAAIGELAMGLRFGFDVCGRNSYEPPEAGDYTDDEDDNEED